MSDDFKFQYNKKTGTFEEYQEPYAMIEIQTEEDYEWLKRIVERGSRMQWHPADEPPEITKDGSSDYVLLNISNFSLLTIGFYAKDEDGSGAYYTDISDEPLCKIGFFVDAWMPLPEKYETEEDKEKLPFD